MTVAEVAEELGVSRTMVRRAIAIGDLASFRDGHVRVFRSAAEAWLARLEAACRQGGF
jgi:excisionase family DNA binding protein